MLQAGVPSKEAIMYFFEDEAAAVHYHDRWMRSKFLKEEVNKLQGKAWQEISTDERISRAVDKHYNEMAWYLYSRNYVDLIGADRAKADTCRQALEVKLAGNAGKGTPIEQFWNDVRSGKLNILSSPKTQKSPAPVGSGLAES